MLRWSSKLLNNYYVLIIVNKLVRYKNIKQIKYAHIKLIGLKDMVLISNLKKMIW